jgi:hypothetical protein
MQLRKSLSIVMIGSSALIAGCGGGGSDMVAMPASSEQPPIASTSTFQIGAAEAAWLQTTSVLSLNIFPADGSGRFVNYLKDGSQVTTTVAPLGSTPVYSSSVYEAWGDPMRGPAPGRISRRTQYYSPAPLTFVGVAVNPEANSCCDLPTQATPLPSTATVGSSGPLYTLAQNANFDYQLTTVSWSLEPDTAQTAWLCQRFDFRGSWIPDAIVIETEKHCLKISDAGAILQFKLDYSDSRSGTALEFR